MEKYEIEHLDFVKNTAGECTLFLKRDDSFPLEKAGKIAAFGNGVRGTIKGGTGSGEVNSRFSVNVFDGLTEAGFDVTTGEWLDAYDRVLKALKEGTVARKQLEQNATRVYRMAEALRKN